MFGLGKKRRILALGALLVAAAPGSARKPDGLLELSVVDADSGKPLPVRIELRNARDRPVRPGRGTEPFGRARLGAHAYLAGTTTLGLKRGVYRFSLDAGPEYRTQHGHFEIDRHADDSKQVAMRRAADIADEGWLAADLGSCRPDADYPLLHEAEGLALTPKAAAAWDGQRWAPPKLAERRKRDDSQASATALWESPRGVVWLVDPDGSFSLADLPEPSDSSVAFLRSAHEGGWRVVAAIASREAPLWIAHELVDAVVVFDDWVDDSGTKGVRPHDPQRYHGKIGPGRWRRALYESLVGAGVALPPVAVSGSGLNKRPIGSARAYAFADRADAWWDAADDLAVVATSGPLLRPRVDGAPPGETFLLRGGERWLQITLGLTTRTPIEYLEVIKNGHVHQTVRLREVAAAGGRLPEVAFSRPGWLALAAVTLADDRYEAALSAPWFVEGAQGGRIDPEQVGFWRAALAEAQARWGETDPEAYARADAWWEARRRNR